MIKMDISIKSLRLYYNPVEEETARSVQAACDQTASLLIERWGLLPPEDCRVYVMTSWLRFLFQSAPWPWKVYLVLTLPWVARRARAIWPHAGGWSLSYGHRKVVGVKPARLMETAGQSLGSGLFRQDRNSTEKVQTVTCHELVHAYTFHLKLPTWLHEGFATLAMEYYLGRPVVRLETLEKILQTSPGRPLRGREKLRMDRQDDLFAQYVFGYWHTRYLDQTRPELLRELLAKYHRQPELEEKIASAYGKDRESYWMGIAAELRAYFP